MTFGFMLRPRIEGRPISKAGALHIKTKRFIKRMAGQHVMWLGQSALSESFCHAYEDVDQYMQAIPKTHANTLERILEDQNEFLKWNPIIFIMFIALKNKFLRNTKQAYYRVHLSSLITNPCMICSNSTYIQRIEQEKNHTSNFKSLYLIQFYMEFSDLKLILINNARSTTIT